MDLILWRHAEARDAEFGANDLDRALTPRGERQAAQMADWLVRHLPDGTRVLASPSRRTRQTAAALQRTFKTVAALAPGTGVAALLAAARWPDARGTVLVVGHQPTLGLVAAHLLAGVDQPWSVKKGAVWWLRRRQRLGGGQTTLVAVRGPEEV
jgi:phosphohistidine phosphatase